MPALHTHPSPPLRLSLLTSSLAPKPPALHPQATLPWDTQPLPGLGERQMAKIRRGGPKELIRGTRVPHPQHLFPQPGLSSPGDGGTGLGEGFCCCGGTEALAPHATPGLWGPARQGEGAAVSIYLMGPHSPSHAVDHGQGRLWGQRHYSLFPLGQPEGLGVLERAAWRGGIDPFKREGHRRRVRSAGGDQEVLYAVCTTRLWGAGDLARPFHTILTRVTFPTLSPVTGPVHHTHPPEEAWGPQHSP